MAGTLKLQYALLSISLFMGAGWAYLAGSKVSLFWERNNLLFNASIFILFLFGILFLNYETLQTGIPWRGDEAYHIVYTLKAVFYLFEVQKTALIPFILLSIIFLTLAFRKSILFLPVGIFLILFLVFSVEIADKNQIFAYGTRQLALRYPFLSRWIHAVVIYIARCFGGEFNEIYYRIVPLISTVILIWYTIRPLEKTNIPLACLWGFAIGTMPVIVYYSSILYLEMPAIVLMTVVCINAEKLLTDDLDTIKTNPAWYALLFIGFIKDNTLPFLLCFLIPRFIANVFNRKSGNNFFQRLREESIVGFCVLLPLILFLCFRWGFLDTNRIFPKIERLLDFDIYKAVLFSFYEQIGVIALFCIPGVIILLKEKRYNFLCFLFLNIFMISLFHMFLGTEVTGYSRYTLLLVPAFLCIANITLCFLINKKKFVFFLVFSCIIINFLMIPLNADGTKKSFWGNPLFDTSEHYYPYREMILWLKENYASEKILFANNGYPYRGLEFYLLKFNWNPRYIISNDADLMKICKKSEKSGIDIIVYKPSPDDSEYKTALECDYFFEHKISNMEHSLIAYKKSGNQ